VFDVVTVPPEVVVAGALESNVRLLIVSFAVAKVRLKEVVPSLQTLDTVPDMALLALNGAPAALTEPPSVSAAANAIHLFQFRFMSGPGSACRRQGDGDRARVAAADQSTAAGRGAGERRDGERGEAAQRARRARRDPAGDRRGVREARRVLGAGDLGVGD